MPQPSIHQLKSEKLIFNVALQQSCLCLQCTKTQSDIQWFKDITEGRPDLHEPILFKREGGGGLALCPNETLRADAAVSMSSFIQVWRARGTVLAPVTFTAQQQYSAVWTPVEVSVLSFLGTVAFVRSFMVRAYSTVHTWVHVTAITVVFTVSP